MKKYLIALLAIVFLGVAASAQEMDTKQEKKRIKKEQKQMRQLDMPANQGQEIKRINARYRDEHKRIMKDASLTQEQKQLKVKALNDKRVAEIHAVIGKEKKDEWEGVKKQEKAMKMEKEKMKEHKGQQKKAEKAAKGNRGKKG
ncbi:MAG TPA: hypothetical protein VK907_09935 [Phnomibacter sp.]|nr:hypothetical protein [Phnomibacter sp.]